MAKAFKDKTVWITGASSGIGEALSYEFARQGANVILSARRESALERVKTQCSTYTDVSKVQILPIDVKESSTFPEKVQKAMSFYNAIDILLNNAGISQRGGALETEVWVEKEIFEVNYFGTVALTRAVLPKMLERRSGSVVCVSSIAAMVATPLRSTYAASKHALHGYYDALRAELKGTGVNVTIVAPGYVRTDISKNALKVDGNPQKTMDRKTNDGMAPEKCAMQIVEAVKRKKIEAHIGGMEKYAVYIRALFPTLAAWMVARIKPV